MKTKIINITNLRKELKSVVEDITENNSVYLVTRPDRKNVVLISENEYKELLKER